MYKYKAISMTEDKIIEEYSDKSIDDIEIELEIRGYYILEIKKNKKYRNIFKRKLNNKELYNFCIEISILLDSGISLVEVLDISIENNYKNKKYRNILESISFSLQQGESFSSSLRKELVFPDYLLCLVEAGEDSGNIALFLKEAGNHYFEQIKYDSKIKNALAYPKILFFIIIIVIYFFLLYIIPSFTSLYDTYEANLPFITQVFLNMSYKLKENKIIIILMFLLTLLFFKNINNIRFFKNKKDILCLKIPFFSKLVNYRDIINFSKTMNIMLDNGFNLYNSILTANKVIDNCEIRNRIEDCLINLKKGIPLSESFKSKKIFNDNYISILMIGEGSGNLTYIFEILYNFYSYEFKIKSEKFIKLIEPVILIILSILIGFLVISIALPMFNIINIIV